MSALLTLAAGDTELALAPAVGGGIAHFRWRGIDIMRAATAPALAARNPLGLAAFPLVPYSNRIAHGRFVWQGREIRLPRNFGDHPHAIHGTGWQAPWTVVRADAASATLAYAHPAGDWPWAFDTTQDFAVRPDGFDYSIAVTNRDATPMPAGLGLHPYFPNPPEVRLTAALDGWWRTDCVRHAARATSRKAVTTGPGACTPRRPPITYFLELRGPVELAWPTHRLTMRGVGQRGAGSSVYAPSGDTLTAVEPVTHPTDTLNAPGHPGVAVLAPSATLTLRIEYRCR